MYIICICNCMAMITLFSHVNIVADVGTNNKQRKVI